MENIFNKRNEIRNINKRKLKILYLRYESKSFINLLIWRKAIGNKEKVGKWESMNGLSIIYVYNNFMLN